MPKLSAEIAAANCRADRTYFVAVALRIFLIRLRTVSLGLAPWPIQYSARARSMFALRSFFFGIDFGLIADILGPLIVIAIAIPFAVSGVRVNPAVGASKSFGLFFLYYILANVASSLATKQLVDPVLAAWLPNIGMTALAVWLFVKLR